MRTRPRLPAIVLALLALFTAAVAAAAPQIAGREVSIAAPDAQQFLEHRFPHQQELLGGLFEITVSRPQLAIPAGTRLQLGMDLALATAGGAPVPMGHLVLTSALRYDVTPDLYVTASYAQGFQHPMQYFGVPLVNGARDRALDGKNYNVGDSDIAFRDSWATVSANWQPSDGLNVTSTLYRMQSNRHWKDAEYYAYLPSSAQVQRSSYTEIFHDQQQYGNVTTATATEPSSSPSSRTASLLMSETTRCGPHCSSTSAITRSATMSVTRPTKRLRAEPATPDGSAGSTAFCLASCASS